MFIGVPHGLLLLLSDKAFLKIEQKPLAVHKHKVQYAGIAVK